MSVFKKTKQNHSATLSQCVTVLDALWIQEFKDPLLILYMLKHYELDFCILVQDIKKN